MMSILILFSVGNATSLKWKRASKKGDSISNREYPCYDDKECPALHVCDKNKCGMWFNFKSLVLYFSQEFCFESFYEILIFSYILP